MTILPRYRPRASVGVVGTVLLLTDSSTANVTATIQNNTGRGLFADDSSVSVSNTTISGNGTSDVALSFATRATLNGNTIGTITCDGLVLSRGSRVTLTLLRGTYSAESLLARKRSAMSSHLDFSLLSQDGFFSVHHLA